MNDFCRHRPVNPTTVVYSGLNPLIEYIEDPTDGPPPPHLGNYDPLTIDQARTWMCYAAFSGDIEKTAISAKVPAPMVRALEHDFNWPTKLKRLKTGAGEAEAEKVANRVVNYLQAQKLRDIVTTAIELYTSEDKLISALVKFRYIKEGEIAEITQNPKAVLDLCKALESIHNCCYRALGDKIPTNIDAHKTIRGGDEHIATVRDVLATLATMQRGRPEIPRVRVPEELTIKPPSDDGLA